MLGIHIYLKEGKKKSHTFLRPSFQDLIYFVKTLEINKYTFIIIYWVYIYLHKSAYIVSKTPPLPSLFNHNSNNLFQEEVRLNKKVCLFFFLFLLKI